MSLHFPASPRPQRTAHGTCTTVCVRSCFLLCLRHRWCVWDALDVRIGRCSAGMEACSHCSDVIRRKNVKQCLMSCTIFQHVTAFMVSATTRRPSRQQVLASRAPVWISTRARTVTYR